MKLIFKLLICLLLFTSCNSINKLYSLYGDAKIWDEPGVSEPNVMRIYFDRYGFVLPDYPISDNHFRDGGSNFEGYYNEHPDIHKRITNIYGVPQIGADTLNTINDPIQAAVIKSYINRINNKKSTYDKLVFLIHGFNKHVALPVDEEKEFRGNSKTEFEGMRRYITAHYPETRFQFVEVYWDGCSARNGRKVGMPFNIYKFWDNAQAHANNIGLELRRLINSLDASTVYMVSHSLGASVVTTSLFNARQFSQNAYNKPDEYISFLLQRQNNPLYNTPTGKIRAGMFAPAIPGANTFDEYGQRTVAGHDVLTSQNNYSFVVGFNEYDQVLNKVIKISSWFGASTLGCRRDDLAAARSEVNGDPAILHDIDFSNPLMNGNGKQRSHSIKDYLVNEHFRLFLDKLFAL